MSFLKKFVPSYQKKGGPDLLQDIVDNLNNILNTKRNFGSILKDFGIRDLNEFNDRDGIVRCVMEEVAQCIDLYEPRVASVSIESDQGADNLFQLSFKINCVVLDTKQSLNMTFDTVFNSFIVE